MRSNLGEVLLRQKLLDADKLKTAVDYQRKNEVAMGTALVSLGYVTEEDLSQALSRQLGYPFIDLNQFEVYPDVINLISSEIARKYLVMPIHRNQSTLTLAMVDPTDLDCLEDIRFRTGLSIQPVIATESGILNAIKKYYGTSDALRVKQIVSELDQVEDTDVSLIEEPSFDEEDEEGYEEAAEEAPIITLVYTVLVDAIKKGASDVHFEPFESNFRVRYRLDGTLHEMMSLAPKFRNPVISRLKILSNIDIAEKRLPQDGRYKIKVRMDDGAKKEVDMRVSCLPTVFGEKVVMRILDKDNLNLDLGKLGFEPRSFELFKKNIARPWGIILVTGPTGSGKTNTLYSAISLLNSMERNIMTAEDPVEFYMPGINQVNIKEEIGLTFSSALRSFLRQDPDIMLVGEMRDFETVDIAIKAALTGHLVFSTVHTNDAASTIVRLINMNVEPFLVADAVALVVAQRLVRRLCKKCSTPQNLPEDALVDVGFKPEEAKEVKILKPTGCPDCNHTGYKGRIGLFEAMEITTEIKDLILNKAASKEIKARAVKQGMITLRQSGLAKVRQEITSIEEVLHETVKDAEVEP